MSSPQQQGQTSPRSCVTLACFNRPWLGFLCSSRGQTGSELRAGEAQPNMSPHAGGRLLLSLLTDWGADDLAFLRHRISSSCSLLLHLP